MSVSEVGRRYAKALYGLAAEAGTAEKVLNDLRVLSVAFQAEGVRQFISSPLTGRQAITNVLKAMFAKFPVSPETQQTTFLMAEKGRLGHFPDMVTVYEEEIDTANNVCRGVVRSASELNPADRQKIGQTVERVLKKKVILTYKNDPSIIGGLVAQVGSYTFDDSIASHLNRLNEDLKRRMV